MAFVRKDFVGGAVSTTLVGGVTALSTSWQIADPTGWPLGTNGPFGAVFSRGVPGKEEKVLCQSLSGSTITLAASSSRGVDGTTAQSHSAPETFEHCYFGADADEANLTVSQTLGQIQAKGDFVSGKSANRLQRTPIGVNDSLIVADSSQAGGFRFGDVPVGGIKSTAQLADGIVTSAKIVWGPYGRVSLAGQSPTAASGVARVMNFDTVDYDTSGLFTNPDPTHTRFTVPTGGDGVWDFSACLAWPPDGTTVSRRYIGLRVDGVTIIGEDPKASIGVAGVGTATSVSTRYLLAVGQYVEVVARQDGAGTLTFAGTLTSHFEASFVRPT